MIPDEAVEVAAAAAYEDVRPRMGFPTGFADAPTPMRDTYRSMARAALEAAAPHMLARAKAEALRDAAEAICEWIGDPSPGGPLTEADWLRARADAWDARPALEGAAAHMDVPFAAVDAAYDAALGTAVTTGDIERILAAAANHLRGGAIATAEELDALPVGSVVLSHAYTHHENGMPIA